LSDSPSCMTRHLSNGLQCATFAAHCLHNKMRCEPHVLYMEGFCSICVQCEDSTLLAMRHSIALCQKQGLTTAHGRSYAVATRCPTTVAALYYTGHTCSTAFVTTWCCSGASTPGILVYSNLKIFRCLNSIRVPQG